MTVKTWLARTLDGALALKATTFARGPSTEALSGGMPGSVRAWAATPVPVTRAPRTAIETPADSAARTRPLLTALPCLEGDPTDNPARAPLC